MATAEDASPYDVGNTDAVTAALEKRYRRFIPKRDAWKRVTGLETGGDVYALAAYTEELKRARTEMCAGDGFTDEVKYEWWLWERMTDIRDERRREKLLREWDAAWSCRHDTGLTAEQRDWLELFVMEAAAEEVEERLAVEQDYLSAVQESVAAFLAGAAHDYHKRNWFEVWCADFRDAWELSRPERERAPSPRVSPRTALVSWKAQLANGRLYQPDSFDRLDAAEASSRVDVSFSFGATVCAAISNLLDAVPHRIRWAQWLHAGRRAYAEAYADVPDAPAVDVDALTEKEVAALYYSELRASRRPAEERRGAPAEMEAGLVGPLV
eukprot:TRINITY_DN32183_c0_g1_i1.p1 TRINITY_DN32183_c0_g1~~TRINITY_DN32183_c0_g1_i1.p1  ORF type:complete len:344 (+),score=124.49 TRINITY_DN32183_c0_g1_i1:55-1032(+)